MNFPRDQIAAQNEHPIQLNAWTAEKGVDPFGRASWLLWVRNAWSPSRIWKYEPGLKPHQLVHADYVCYCLSHAAPLHWCLNGVSGLKQIALLIVEQRHLHLLQDSKMT
ncbi:hypothetical protein E2562_025008 [Oryza meyeriana var. granulata]|uniref:Uncharacterized protein n=1 Tax=Oryza meyeriana var. granulata TaxID=110450 RepID=A0A6G1FBX7_9ORYZ|nr:hypothetical protein E2562_025008 [Oryza meyeriana var. granulata]